MNRRVVRSKCAKDPQTSDLSDQPERENADCLKVNEDEFVDWTRLPDDTMIKIFTHLNYGDRANLSSTCKSWRSLGSSSFLWQSLDLRAHSCDWRLMRSLASRCSNLQNLWFRGSDDIDSLINIRAKNLKKLCGDCCRMLNDSSLATIAARHQHLESIQLTPDLCENITSNAIVAIGFSCPKLKKLRLSGIRDANKEAISALVTHCADLHEIGFIDCLRIDEVALGNVVSLRFLSVAGTTNVNWDLAGENWSKLPNLIGLDVSRTNMVPSVAMMLFSSSKSLKVMCAFSCPTLEEDTTVYTKTNRHGKMMLSSFIDTFEELSRMFPDTDKEHAIFSHWRNGPKKKDGNVDEIMIWVEWILAHLLLRLAKANPNGLDPFWLDQGSDLLLTLLQSSQEDVQEWAATGLATFAVVDDLNTIVDVRRTEAVMKGGVVQLLLGHARYWKEGLQSQATKAIANLSLNPAFAKSIAESGGIAILASLAKSMNRLVAEEAAGGLGSLSIGKEHKGAVVEAGGIKALVDLIFKWPRGANGVLERAAGALANLAADDKCSVEIASLGGINALVTLARSRNTRVQKEAARALANLTAHGDSNTNNSAVGQEAGAIDALILLVRSQDDAVRLEAAGALWSLSFNEENRERIALAGGVEALVSLAKSCSDASPSLKERAAGALWGLSASEANSIAIGREGGIEPLILLAHSRTEDVRKTAAGALWSLAVNPENALLILEQGGVMVLMNFYTSTSKMGRFMAGLALACMFDGRMEEYGLAESTANGRAYSSDGVEWMRMLALNYVENCMLKFDDPQVFAAASLSSASAPLIQAAQYACIVEAGQLRCSGAEIARFVSMLRSRYTVFKSCAAFALLQFTFPGGRHATHHVNLLRNLGAQRILRATAAAVSGPLDAKVFARIVLRNLEHQQTESSAQKRNRST